MRRNIYEFFLFFQVGEDSNGTDNMVRIDCLDFTINNIF